jgi:hypothetical protein
LERTDYESTGIGKKDLPQLQDRAPQGCALRDLHREKAQAAAGLRLGRRQEIREISGFFERV